MKAEDVLGCEKFNPQFQREKEALEEEIRIVNEKKYY